MDQSPQAADLVSLLSATSGTKESPIVKALRECLTADRGTDASLTAMWKLFWRVNQAETGSKAADRVILSVYVSFRIRADEENVSVIFTFEGKDRKTYTYNLPLEVVQSDNPWRLHRSRSIRRELHKLTTAHTIAANEASRLSGAVRQLEQELAQVEYTKGNDDEY